MTEFSLDLNEDQLTLGKWVHDFAANVLRPQAAEWDEREEFPYPVVEEAASIGLYGWDHAQRPDRAVDPCRTRGVVLG